MDRAERPRRAGEPAGPTAPAAALRVDPDPAYGYIRDKVNQLLTVMGTLPIGAEELDDETLIGLDPIGIIAESFRQVLAHLHDTNEALTLARDELRTVLDSAGTAILVVDRDSRIELCNRLAATLVDGADQAAPGHCLKRLLDGRAAQVELEIFGNILRTGSAVERTDVRRGNRHYHLVATPLSDAGGEVSRVVFCYTDITRQKEHQRELEYIAHYDTLTELPNRVLLADRLRQAMAQTRRRGNRLAVTYLDLDGFKAVNDSHGHEVGDQLLRVLAGRMKGSLRQGDTIARVGGDEFVAVLMDLGSAEATAPLLTRLLDAASQPVQLDERVLRVSASLGVAFYPQAEDLAPEQLLRHADQAMYQAKLAGKNRYHVFDAEGDRHARGRNESVERIRLALRRGELVLRYQPMVNMRSGEVVGTEALIRWQHPERGLLAPAAFLPVIEDQPLSIEVGEWVIDTALAQLEVWHAQGHRHKMSVNVGPLQLQDARFMERLQALLAAHPGAPPEKLQLEILETGALEDVSRVSQVMRACEALRIRFSLDDFGTGYSTLTYLKRLPAAQLKIDRSFVSGMLEDPEDLAILEGVLGLSAAFRRTVIAEGVETLEHGEMLLRLGCEVAQGYYIARPMPAADVAAWKRKWRPPAAWRERAPVCHHDLPLLFAAVEHRAWVETVELALAKGSERADAPPSDACRFNRWLEEDGRERHGTQPAFHRLEAVHETIHGLAEELLRLCAAGRGAEARGRLGELRGLRDELLSELTSLVHEAPA